MDMDMDIDIDIDIDVETPASFSLYDKPQRKKYVEACKNIVYPFHPNYDRNRSIVEFDG